MEINKQDLQRASLTIAIMSAAYIIVDCIFFIGYEVGLCDTYKFDGGFAILGCGMLIGAFYYRLMLNSLSKKREQREYVERLEQENAELKGKNND